MYPELLPSPSGKEVLLSDWPHPYCSVSGENKWDLDIHLLHDKVMKCSSLSLQRQYQKRPRAKFGLRALPNGNNVPLPQSAFCSVRGDRVRSLDLRHGPVTKVTFSTPHSDINGGRVWSPDSYSHLTVTRQPSQLIVLSVGYKWGDETSTSSWQYQGTLPL